MQYGFVKTAAAAIETVVADCTQNGRAIAQAIDRSESLGAQLLVLPELCITGATCGDLFFQTALITAAKTELCAIIKHTKGKKIIAVLGVPLLQNGMLYNCAVAVQNGHALAVVPKTRVAGEDTLNQRRYFAMSLPKSDYIELCGENVAFNSRAVLECEECPDFAIGIQIGDDCAMPLGMAETLAAAGAVIIANPTVSSETADAASQRSRLIGSMSGVCVAAIVSAWGGHESTTDAVYGGQCAIAENGKILAMAKPFGNGFAVSDVDCEALRALRRRMSFPTGEGKISIDFSLPQVENELTRDISAQPFIPSEPFARAAKCDTVLNIQARGLAARLAHTSGKCAVIGISGGLDSTLAMLVASNAMKLLKRPQTDILAVTMPCFGTTARTRGNAEALCEALHVRLECVDITESVKRHFEDIGQKPDNYDVTFENAQARERTQVLMDIANRENGMVIGTGDLSELALGWATYNGDHMSMYGVNAGVCKTLVRYIVKYYADTCRDTALSAVLCDVLDTPVSPELLPAENGEISQKTENLVGPYQLHDFFIYYVVRRAFAPDKIFYLAKAAFKGVYDDETILKWLKIFYRRFFSQQFKRSCLPDGAAIGTVSFSPRGAWQMPSDASAAVWRDAAEKL